jgi:hypothetical protein
MRSIRSRRTVTRLPSPALLLAKAVVVIYSLPSLLLNNALIRWRRLVIRLSVNLES